VKRFVDAAHTDLWQNACYIFPHPSVMALLSIFLRLRHAIVRQINTPEMPGVSEKILPLLAWEPSWLIPRVHKIWFQIIIVRRWVLHDLWCIYEVKTTRSRRREGNRASLLR
jgi:hypothetical protein